MNRDMRKNSIQGFRPSKISINLLSYRDKLNIEIWHGTTNILIR